MAHVDMLGKQGVIPVEDAKLIHKTLLEILDDIENGKVVFDEKAEDIHMNVETILISRIGDVGKKLHTGRERRNHQVALDIRMYVKEQITDIRKLMLELIDGMYNIAEANINTIMPGYTHLQRAQPVTLAHHVLAYCEMFKRDIERLDDTYKRTNVMPLGLGACWSNLSARQSMVADTLGFAAITLDSMDGVSTEISVLSFFMLSIIMMHLSRFCGRNNSLGAVTNLSLLSLMTHIQQVQA